MSWPRSMSSTAQVLTTMGNKGSSDTCYIRWTKNYKASCRAWQWGVWNFCIVQPKPKKENESPMLSYLSGRVIQYPRVGLSLNPCPLGQWPSLLPVWHTTKKKRWITQGFFFFDPDHPSFSFSIERRRWWSDRLEWHKQHGDEWGTHLQNRSIQSRDYYLLESLLHLLLSPSKALIPC